mgnify:CR=1 FL=1
MLEVALALVAGVGVGWALAGFLKQKGPVTQQLVALVQAVQADRQAVIDRSAAATHLSIARASEDVQRSRELADMDRATLQNEIHRLQGFVTQLMQGRVSHETSLPEEVALKVPTLSVADRVAQATGDERSMSDEAKAYQNARSKGLSHEDAVKAMQGDFEDLATSEHLESLIDGATMASTGTP